MLCRQVKPMHHDMKTPQDEKLFCDSPLASLREGGYDKSTARIPVRKMPSKVPAPPMDATGAFSLLILCRLSRSAPIRVPNVPAT